LVIVKAPTTEIFWRISGTMTSIVFSKLGKRFSQQTVASKASNSAYATCKFNIFYEIYISEFPK
jgi:hypothetical protein